MALTFPISASIGQTYQSGSSNTYEWTGTYWKIKNVINFNVFSASIVDRVNAATNEQDLSYLATTGSNTFIGEQVVSGSILISGSLVPATGQGTFTSSFTLGSPTNAWKDLYISNGSIIFVDAVTQATSSFSIDNEVGQSTVKYTAAITASQYFGDGGGLFNLPSNTNWNHNKEYVLKNTEQLTFSGDYILESSTLLIEGSKPNSIGVWTDVNVVGNGSIARTANRTYTINGPQNNSNSSGWLFIKRYFDTPTTMSIGYDWTSTDGSNDWPMYEINPTEQTGEMDNTNRLINANTSHESGTWEINVPAQHWLAIGVYSNDSAEDGGRLQITLPYILNEDVQYAPNKYFKEEGSIFIGGNLLLKNSTIQNNGKISVGGEVILIGNSKITGTGTII